MHSVAAMPHRISLSQVAGQPPFLAELGGSSRTAQIPVRRIAISLLLLVVAFFTPHHHAHHAPPYVALGAIHTKLTRHKLWIIMWALLALRRGVRGSGLRRVRYKS